MLVDGITLAQHAEMFALAIDSASRDEVGNALNEATEKARDFAIDGTLTTIMGRESAYTGKAVTWDEMMKSELDLTPPQYEFGPLPVRPLPIPGRSR